MQSNIQNKVVRHSISTLNSVTGYDHYIAVDWSKKNMAIARISSKTPNKIKSFETQTDIKELMLYLKEQRGKKILTIEESTSAHWLYIKLHNSVDKIIICDPVRNRLLSEGPKNDPIDAKKLCLLLQAGLLKEVYHTTEKIYHLRKYVSAYEDLVKLGVRLKNQQSALLTQNGGTNHNIIKLKDPVNKFINGNLEELIDNYEKMKQEYESKFEELCRKDKNLKNLKSLPGIGNILAVKILAITIDPKRFKKAGNYLGYCGLVKHLRMSGGMVYGKKKPRYNRILKAVFKIAANVVLNGKSPIKDYYDYLINKGTVDFNARHAVARYLARLAYGILKDGKPYKPNFGQKKKIERKLQAESH